MNLVLLEPEDLVGDDRAVVSGRRLKHIREVHRAAEGDRLTVGVLAGRCGTGLIMHLDESQIEFRLQLDRDPPQPLPLTLVLALPRPKVLNRVVAAATSLGVKQIVLMNAWRVEKSYWGTPRLSPDNLRAQAILGLEQAEDTVLPEIRVERLFRPFVENALPSIAGGSRLLVAHPMAAAEAPRGVSGRTTLVIGPEGGFVEKELESLAACGAEFVTVGPRILRVETAIASIIGRLH